MDISIIIVNWNTRDLLGNCLKSIHDWSGHLAVQTIVVDNNSSDGSREMVEAGFPGVDLMNSGGNLGFARANNLALPHVRSPLVLYLNPDTEIRDRGLHDMLDFMATHSDVGGLGCRIRDVSGQIQELGLQWFPSPLTELVKFVLVSQRSSRWLKRFIPHHDSGTSGYVTKLFGACLLVRKEVLDKVGAFDERFFMYCEDVDLCHRIIQGGWKLYYMSEVEILHLGGSAGDAAPGGFSVLMMCESFSKFMGKHHGRLGRVGYRLAALVGSQVRLLMLFMARIAFCNRGKKGVLRITHSIQKYRTITRWALGLQRPVIKQ